MLVSPSPVTSLQGLQTQNLFSRDLFPSNFLRLDYMHLCVILYNTTARIYLHLEQMFDLIRERNKGRGVSHSFDMWSEQMSMRCQGDTSDDEWILTCSHCNQRYFRSQRKGHKYRVKNNARLLIIPHGYTKQWNRFFIFLYDSNMLVLWKFLSQ